MHCFGCLHMIVNGCIHKMIKSQKALASMALPNITSFSRMQKIEVTGVSDLTSLFSLRAFLYSISILFVGCFCYTML